MNKFIALFRVSVAQEFAYRFNFVMWRVRNVLQILLVFFLWNAVFMGERVVFGYTEDKILTYVLGVLLIRAFVVSSRAIDVASDISRGDLSNYLLKPVNYFSYWLTRDLSSKFLNTIFAFVEITLLFLVLRPSFYIQTDIMQILGFSLAVISAILLFFFLVVLVSFIAFWAPEQGWSGQFLFVVIFTEFLSGSVFPLDILPSGLQTAVYMTPFPYLIYFPLKIYLGEIVGSELIKTLLVSILWIFILSTLTRSLWRKGLERYSSEGR